MKMQLQVNGVSKSYVKHKYALENISMSLTPGIYGVLGPNGAGKTTLINILIDNIFPDCGTVVYNGQDIHTLKEQYRAVVGYMPQQQVLCDNLTGEEFLWYMASLKGIDRKSCKDLIYNLLVRTNLYKEKDKKIGSYSGGMKQRILIAQALLNDPQILIMDEPTAGLDPSERIRIRNLLSTLSEHKIILIATHIVSDIETIAKEIILISNGKIIRMGTPNQLLTEIDDKVYEIKTSLDTEYADETAKISTIRVGEHEKIYKVVQDKAPKNVSYTKVKAGLEELYLYHFL